MSVQKARKMLGIMRASYGKPPYTTNGSTKAKAAEKKKGIINRDMVSVKVVENYDKIKIERKLKTWQPELETTTPTLTRSPTPEIENVTPSPTPCMLSSLSPTPPETYPERIARITEMVKEGADIIQKEREREKEENDLEKQLDVIEKELEKLREEIKEKERQLEYGKVKLAKVKASSEVTLRVKELAQAFKSVSEM